MAEVERAHLSDGVAQHSFLKYENHSLEEFVLAGRMRSASAFQSFPDDAEFPVIELAVVAVADEEVRGCGRAFGACRGGVGVFQGGEPWRAAGASAAQFGACAGVFREAGRGEAGDSVRVAEEVLWIYAGDDDRGHGRAASLLDGAAFVCAAGGFVSGVGWTGVAGRRWLH